VWLLPNGEELGWQAKFITESPRAKHWSELDDSVKTALERNPSLRRYTICLPTLLPEDRRPRRKSARQIWNEHVEKWTAWCMQRGSPIEFLLWDETVLLDMLAKPRHLGRRAFWFGGPAFTSDWFTNNGVRPAVRQAHTRYSPPLHVKVAVQQTLDALTRDQDFHRRIVQAGEQVRATVEETLRFILDREDGTQNGDVRESAKQFVEILCQWPSTIAEPFDSTRTKDALNQLKQAVTQAEATAWSTPRSAADDKHFVISQIRDLKKALDNLEEFLASPELGAALLGRAVIAGDAGSGKTHLFCATAEKQIARQRPVILLLGEQFNSTSEPWTQIQQLLGLDTTRDELLGALDAVGEACCCRAIIMIDALNEGAGVAYWRKYLGAIVEHIRPFPHVGLALSVREAYARDVTKILGADWVFVEHQGFRGQLTEASRRFFAHYRLAEPNVPVLDPEYENPLFLKLLCEALRSRGDLRLSDPPSFSALLQMVLDDANARLATTLDYDPAERYVHRAIQLLGRLMADQQTEFLSWPLVIEELQKLKPSDSRSRSLAQHLLAEDLIVRIPNPDSMSGEECVRFAYQRFSDYVIVTDLLERAQKAGKDGAEILGRVSGKAEWLPAARSWVQAIATLSPELGGPELPQMAPDRAKFPSHRDAFLHSIVWRKRSSISPETEKELRKLLARTNEAHPEALHILLSLGTRPDHPFNSDWLDQLLRPMPMPERDAFWSTAIFGGWKENGAVRRLIEWASQEDVAVSIPEEVVRLAAVSLTWMLTTSDRFVRDRATKALVSLLESQISVLRRVMLHFSGVREPYLQERLHAIAYGCALRTRDERELKALAQDIYDRVFRHGRPPPSVLLRDHARGAIESARRRGAQLDCDPKLIVPPYRSDQPNDPPSDDELRRRYRYDAFDDGHGSLARVYESVTADDFNHYVIRDVTYWSGTLRGVPVRRSPRKLFRAMLARLSQNDADMIEQLARAYGLALYPNQQNTELFAAIRAAEAELPKELGKARSRLFLTRIKPYLENPNDSKFNDHFSIELLERLILQRVLELGWRSELFDDFDATVSSAGREDHKPERIGKKYQWMAYDELHARISDNYGLADTETRVMDKQDWERGLWPTNYRDLDPSLLIRKTPREGWGANHCNWWTPHRYGAWLSKPTPLEWLKSFEDLPPITDFLRLRDSIGETWLLLYGFHLWRRKVEPQGTWRPQRDRQELHLIFRSYLTKRKDLAAMMRWAKKQNWINDRLPSPHNHFHVHLFEHYFSPQFDDPLDNEWIAEMWPANDLPAPILLTTGEYLCEHGTYDCSVDSTVNISIPSRWLAEKLALRPSGRHGDFVATDGRVVTFDPSTRERGQSVLLIREGPFLKLLESEDLAIFWTLLGEKNYYPPERSPSWPGRLTILGAYSTQDGQISGGFHTEFQNGRE
jgi:hypothetical protein